MRSLESIISNNERRQAAYDAKHPRPLGQPEDELGDVTGFRGKPEPKPVIIRHDLTSYYKAHPFDSATGSTRIVDPDE